MLHAQWMRGRACRSTMKTISSFITFFPGRFDWTHICRYNQTQSKSFENRQLSFASLHFGIDWPLFTFHMDTHANGNIQTAPQKIASTHAGYRKSEVIAYQFSLSPVWRPSRSQRGRRGQIIAYQEKWTVNALASKEKNGGVCSSRGLTLLKCRQVIIIKKTKQKTSYKCESLSRQIVYRRDIQRAHVPTSLEHRV